MDIFVFAAFGIPTPEKEYKFCASRRWRFDYAWPRYFLALEIEGGVWSRGRHVRPVGFIRDIEKYNAAAEAGWRIIRYLPGKIDYAQVRRIIYNKENTADCSCNKKHPWRKKNG